MALIDHYVSSSGVASYAASTSSATPCSLTTALTTASVGDRINIKNDGTYNLAADAVCNGGSFISPVVLRGYLTTPGDGYLGRTNGNGPLITTNMPLISFAAGGDMEFGDHTLIETIQFAGSVSAANVTNGSAENFIVWSFSTMIFYRCCTFTNTNVGGVVDLKGNSSLIDCDVTGGTGADGVAAVQCFATLAKVIGNRITIGTGSYCIFAVANAVIKGNTLFRAFNGIGFSGTVTNILIDSNTIVNNSSDGISGTSTGATGASVTITNNCITDNGGYGIKINAGGSGISFISNNRLRDNTSGPTNVGDWGLATNYNAITSGAGTSDYINAAGNDYRLKSTSPAIAIGFPSSLDAGALQHLATSGGIIVPQFMEGGF